MMPERLVDVIVDGKYRVYQEYGGHTWADRYDDKKWLDVTMSPGGKMVLAMAYEIDRLRSIEIAYNRLCEMLDGFA